MKIRYIIIVIGFLATGCNTVPEEKGNSKKALLNQVPALMQENKTKESSTLIEKIDNSNDSISLRYGTSFGECIGYCHMELKITSEGIKYTKSAMNIREDLPKLNPFVKAIPFSKSDWKKLTDNIDFINFTKLDDRIGCPDCLDGGAEWIEIGFNGKLKMVTFECGASIEELNKLLDQIRKLKTN